MSYKKIFLINPPYAGARVRVIFSAGLGYIAQILESKGYDYQMLDMSLGYSYQDLKNRTEEFKPDLIGVSMMTNRYRQSYELIENLKRDFPHAKIIVGGPHMSLFREQVLSECAAIDFGVVLEGEQTLIEVCQGIEPSLIKGLIFRKEGEVIFNGQRPFISNLDEIPFPRYEKFELERSIKKQMTALPIVSSRGCPFDCVYCPVQSSIGSNFRARSPESIIKELEYWVGRGYNRFSFADDNFTLFRDRIEKFCNLIKESKLENIHLSCDNGIRADKVDKRLLALMKEVGFYRIAFGVEAGNDKILKNLRKSESIKTITARIKEAGELGYEVSLFFLVGSPGETWEDLQDSFKIALNCSMGTSFFYNIIPFPHTPLFEWIKENGKFLKDPAEYLNDYPILDNEPVFETPDMPYEIRKKALKKAFAITHKTMRFSLKKRFSRLGVFAAPAAFLYATRLMQDVILRNRFLKRMVYHISKILMR